MTINNDIFPELNHELIKPLREIDDLLLWQLWQKNPQQARYLIILFYRYANLSAWVENDLLKLEINEYYFENLWFFIMDKIYDYKITYNSVLSEIIINLIKQFLREETIIINQISDKDHNFKVRFLPLKYYLEKSLDKLLPIERIILVTKDKFGWEDDKILEYLQQQKENITMSEIKAYYSQGHSRLINYLPTDIISIYLQND